MQCPGLSGDEVGEVQEYATNQGASVGGLSFPHLVLQSVGMSRARSANS